MLPPGATCPFLHLHEARYPYYPWVERGTVQVSILPKDVISNEPVSTVLGSNPGAWDYNPNTLTTEPPKTQDTYHQIIYNVSALPSENSLGMVNLTTAI